MLDDLLQRKPYNAVTDFVDAPVARGSCREDRFHRRETFADLRRVAEAYVPFRDSTGTISDCEPEERLALLLYDTIDFPVAFWGAMRAGIVALPLNTLLTAEQYAYILADSRASAIVVAAPLAKTIIPILDRLPQLRTVILVDGDANAPAALAPAARFA